ncbi:MAG TPA: bifunctional glutamate N-acetyltransferase/amino-acid acetyltransferase ArgJ [Spirochaetota bacterium]|nr:bifunctional glutamate N-acetyltransferase/amino-acid acetyltransferase ArgJ [Spirochaetota bacterium]HOM38745.1 bifunctional glutamate N-acetyltransferase/amino-acid acetyltransferase ArgJ [Spirochaetota bacterium]HPQ49543.1 bifunctional glutamate N-acetyltransferase/amino-acid acetyltransferase ArgJ [Spirochaetota bacterium]
MLKLPSGYSVYTTSASIKKPGRKDIGLIFSDRPAVYSGVFTKNVIKAAPVNICIKRLKDKKNIRLVMVNSGNANACTGDDGYKDSIYLLKELSKKFNVNEDECLPLSTGVIGVRLPVDRMVSSFANLVLDEPEEFAKAIMTTDTFPKYAYKEILIDGKMVTITGFAKGSGMIHPNMATMLGFILTDASISMKISQKILKSVADNSFNKISVDGDMSTNDSLILLSNGASDVEINSKNYDIFYRAILEIAKELSYMIVKDGEGATKVVKIIVNNAYSVSDADKIARTIANSLLVKTALFGNDPNWGRIVASIGYSGALKIDEKRIKIIINDILVFKDGKPTDFDKVMLSNSMKSKENIIIVDMGIGIFNTEFITCDLSYDYVKINAEYTT